MTDLPLWKNRSGAWVQDDEKKRFFMQAYNGGRPVSDGSGSEVLLGAKWHRTSNQTVKCGGLFPPDFRFCPFCGEKLSGLENRKDKWCPPFGGTNGLRLLSSPVDAGALGKIQRDGSAIAQEKNSLSMPRPGDHEFIVANSGNNRSILIAFDKNKGLVDYFSPAARRWIPLPLKKGEKPVASSRLPAWSWAAAFAEEKRVSGFGVPTDKGPVWVAIDWEKQNVRQVSGPDRAIGGAAGFSNRIFIPVLADKGVSITEFNPAGMTWQEAAHVSVPPEAGIFSVPVVDEDRQTVYWISGHGMLIFEAAGGTCRWRPWKKDSDDCRAVPEFGPPFRDSLGDFWQICYDEPEDAFRYFKLNGDEADYEYADGGRFTSGISCFSKPYDHWDKPWTTVDEMLEERAGAIRFPLLCLDEAEKLTLIASFGSTASPPLLKLIRDTHTPFTVDFFIEGPDQLPIPLETRESLNIYSPWELRVFVYDNYLYLYLNESAQCCRWRLRHDPSRS